MTGVDRVGSVRDLILPPGALLTGDLDWEERRYATPRQRKLAPAQEHAIRIAAGRGSTLRALAAAHGVSHETVARIVREDISPGQPFAPESGLHAVALAD